MRMMNSSMFVFLRQGARIGLQIGSCGSGTCGGWNCVSSTPLGFLEYMSIYRAERWWKGPPWAPPPTWVRQGPLACPGGLWAPRASPLMLPWLPSCLLVQNKISKKFRGIWTSFGTDILRSKKQAKMATVTGHYVNRLVPKIDIKVLVNEYKTSKIDTITAWNNKKLHI